MVRSAHILPTKHLVRNHYSTYHLCLTHLILRAPEYRRFYAERSRCGDFVILDNSAHEHGVGEPGEALALAARLIKPSEVVLPDCLFNAETTIELSRSALSAITPLKVPWMVVPQGRDLDEWRACLDQLMELNPSTIGISKDFEVWGPTGLVPLIEYTLQFGLPIHLLGWGRKLWLLPEYIAAGQGRVRGIDSAKPAVYAYAGVALPEDLSQAPGYPKRPVNFFQLPLDAIDKGFLEHNIDVFSRAAGGLG